MLKKPQRRVSFPRTDRHAIDVVCTEHQNDIIFRDHEVNVDIGPRRTAEQLDVSPSAPYDLLSPW